MMQFENNIQCAAALDAHDPLARYREEFLLPSPSNKSATYFLGNSLGLQPRTVKSYLNKVLDQWSEKGVESFFNADPPWMEMHNDLRASMSVIAGALPTEISIMNQLTVNIHLMLTTFYQPKGKKRKILIEAKAFPSDQYALRSYVRHLGMDPDEVIIEVHGDVSGRIPNDEQIVDAIGRQADEIALVFLGGINYYNGQLFDMASIAKAAHKYNILIGFDLAHAIGNVELRLHDWDIDFACWCSYKYMNGGPGAVAAVYIHQRFHQDSDMLRLAGWWGYEKKDRFLMNSLFSPEGDASGWQVSTPSILLYACLKSSLAVFEKAGWENILKKQTLMIQWEDFLLETLPQQHFKRLTPLNRGCQVSLLFPQKGKEVFDLLVNSGYMVDWREPDVIRFAPVPLYNSFSEVWNFFDQLKVVLGQVFSEENHKNLDNE